MFRFLSWVERRWMLSALDEFELEGSDEKWTYLVQIILALLGIVNRWLVTIVPKMSRGNKSIATCSHQPFPFSPHPSLKLTIISGSTSN
jgi:hypothetical protein